MTEFLYLVAIAIVLLAIIGFFKQGLKKLKSIQLKVDFSEKKSSKRLIQ
jgi:hypothetical protein